MANVQCHNPIAVADRWAANMNAYPYWTTFVRNMLYIAFNAMTNPNGRLDLNAQADLDLMTHLLGADVVVSNEQGFLRQAFNDLWRPLWQGAVHVDEFVRLLAKL